jgi:hypothetical protein
MKKSLFLLIMVYVGLLYGQSLTFELSDADNLPIHDTNHFIQFNSSNYIQNTNELKYSISNPTDYCKDFEFWLIPENIFTVVYGQNIYNLKQFRVDIENDGSFEMDWRDNGAYHFYYDFPEPENGISQERSIRIELQYIFPATNDFFTKVYILPVMTIATPKIFSNEQGDYFVELSTGNHVKSKPLLFVEGFDPLNTHTTSYYYGMAGELINSYLAPDEYVPFILNFSEGGRDMRENSEVLSSALEKIHSLFPGRLITLVGLSMGGVVSHYTLSKMEYLGLEHHVGTFVSYDSPQQGANISYALQSLIGAADPSLHLSIAQLHQSLGSMAAKQLLVKNYFDLIEYNGRGHEHNSFYDEMGSYGYPEKCYNVAVANGALATTYDLNMADEPIFELSVELSDLLGGGGTSLTVPATVSDIGVGSKTDLGMKNTSTLATNIGPFLLYLGYTDIKVNFDPVFIPTYSALDLRGVQFDSEYNISSLGSSPFDKIIYQGEGYDHAEVTSHSIDELISVLENGMVDVILKNEYAGENIVSSKLSVIGVNSDIQSNTSVPLPNQNDYTITTNYYPEDEEIRFYTWKNESGSYKYKREITVEHGIANQVAEFDNIKQITINSGVANDIKFHDPWYISNPGDDPEEWVQPDDFRLFSDMSSDGSYDVFLSQGDPGNPASNLPIYSLKAPRYYADTEHIYEFDEWQAFDVSNNPVSVDNSAFIWVVSKNSLTSEVVFKQAGV